MRRFWILLSLSVLLVSGPLRAATNHGLSAVYHWSHIETEEEQTFNFHSPGISYSIATGRKLGFLGRFTLFFPRALYQDGAYFAAKDFYSSSWGFEMLLGASMKFPLKHDLLVIAGLGAHLNSIRMDSDEYENFQHSTVGIGLDAQLYYPVHKNFSLGGFVLASGHFIDLIHSENAQAYGFFVSAGLTVEFHLE